LHFENKDESLMVTRKKIVLGCTTVLLSSCVTEYEFSSQSYSFGQAVVSGKFRKQGEDSEGSYDFSIEVSSYEIC
jgi:hypothetical protein